MKAQCVSGSVRRICESRMSMNWSTEILDLIRGGWVSAGDKGVAPRLKYCPIAASQQIISPFVSASMNPNLWNDSFPRQMMKYRPNHLACKQWLFLTLQISGEVFNSKKDVVSWTCRFEDEKIICIPSLYVPHVRARIWSLSAFYIRQLL